MLPPCKRPRTFTPERNIPFDLVLEIAVRSDDAATVVRLGATCRALRRDILNDAFLRRVFHEPGHTPPPSCVLGFLHAYDDTTSDARRPPLAPYYSLAHPATPEAARLAGQLARFVSRSVGNLLDHYDPLTSSRHGLVALHRRYIGKPRRPEICVYVPMTGDRVFLPRPPCVRQGSKYGVGHAYVLLTAEDGMIGCSFLLVADFARLRQDRASQSFLVQTFASKAGKRSPTTAAGHPRLRRASLQPRCAAVVLGGTVHWLMDQPGWFIGERFFILTYDVRTAEAGTIELPPAADLPDGCTMSNLHLASSPDGKLSLLVADKLRISVWLLLPDGAGWSRHAVINTRATVKSLLPHDTPPEWWLAKVIEFSGSFSGGRIGAILVRPFNKEFNDQPQEDGEGLVVLDLETKEMRRAKRDRHVQAFPFEIDLKSRLSTMKTF